MCRVTGFWDLNYRGAYGLERTVDQMNQTLVHGGPDEQGFYCNERLGLALANCRLAILDLSPLGHQPMFSDDNQICLVFNGEIYNFAEIKKELEGLGLSFKSHSDTEVIIKAYQKWGIDCLNKFRGMFAFALFDRAQEKLFLVRDRIGVKPIYYFWQNGLFIFASETRAIFKHPQFQKEISAEGVATYFQFGYIPHPFSIWQNVFKLPPGCFLTVSRKEGLKIQKYWDLQDYYLRGLSEQSVERNELEILSQLENILTDSFRLRLVSDVPVGVFLSGGIDSSIVAALLQKDLDKPLRTFTIGFEDKDYNEAEYAKQIANHLKTNHTELYCTQKEALEIVPNLPEIYDEPFGDSSAVPTFLISKLARQEVKVVLSGDGGDEFFAGYDKYWNQKMLQALAMTNKLPGILGLVGGKISGLSSNEAAYRVRKFSQMVQAQNIFEQFADIATGFFPAEISNFVNIKQEFFLSDILGGVKDDLLKLDPVSLWMFFDAKLYLPEDILTKVDRASMHNALEAREPLLDHQMIEFICGLPINFKCDDKSGKHLLKKILNKYLPKKYWDRPKHGFSIPMRAWLLNDLKPLVDEFLGERCIKEVGVLDYQAVNNLRKSFFGNKNSNPYRIWYLLIFQMWATRWLV
ncbi:MAG: asparagine synthase (glutamine-hydrolyzing) [Candidatus Pacebacteria bacterium]|nr:asparagine synthase (glutamine-hydrolyzing) [Candidatus Paceibacterota bacterium]